MRIDIFWLPGTRDDSPEGRTPTSRHDHAVDRERRAAHLVAARVLDDRREVFVRHPQSDLVDLPFLEELHRRLVLGRTLGRHHVGFHLRRRRDHHARRRPTTARPRTPPAPTSPSPPRHRQPRRRPLVFPRRHRLFPHGTPEFGRELVHGKTRADPGAAFLDVFRDRLVTVRERRFRKRYASSGADGELALVVCSFGAVGVTSVDMLCCRRRSSMNPRDLGAEGARCGTDE